MQTPRRFFLRPCHLPPVGHTHTPSPGPHSTQLSNTAPLPPVADAMVTDPRTGHTAALASPANHHHLTSRLLLSSTSSSSTSPSPSSSPYDNNNQAYNNSDNFDPETAHITLLCSSLSVPDKINMGLAYNVYLNSARIYGCKTCKTHLSNHDDIISRVSSPSPPPILPPFPLRLPSHTLTPNNPGIMVI